MRHEMPRQRKHTWRWLALCVWLLVGALSACGPNLALLNDNNGLYINGIAMTASGTGWAVGLEPGKHKSVLIQATHGSWVLAASQPPVTLGDDLKAVAAIGSTVWVAGSNTDDTHGNSTQETGFIATKSADGAWQRDRFGSSINALAFLSPTDGWGVGDSGLIVHWTGGSWVTLPDSMNEPLYSVAFRSPTDGWAGGFLGDLLHYDGTQWQPATHITHESFMGLALSATDGWAAMTSGEVFRQENGVWTGDAAPINTNNNAATIDASGNAWLVGDHGSVFEYQMSSDQWQHIAQPADEQLNAVAADPAGVIWVAGNSTNANFYAWDGTRWRTDTVALTPSSP